MTWVAYKDREGKPLGLIIAEDITHIELRETKGEGEYSPRLHIWVTIGRGDAQGVFIVSDPELTDDDGWAALWEKATVFAGQFGGPTPPPAAT